MWPPSPVASATEELAAELCNTEPYSSSSSSSCRRVRVTPEGFCSATTGCLVLTPFCPFDAPCVQPLPPPPPPPPPCRLSVLSADVSNSSFVQFQVRHRRRDRRVRARRRSTASLRLLVRAANLIPHVRCGRDEARTPSLF